MRQEENIKDIKNQLSVAETKTAFKKQDSKLGIVSLHKRIEKVGAALFLVSDLMSDSNPIRHRVRVICVEVMSFMFTTVEMFGEDGVLYARRVSNHLLELLSLLEVSFLANQISGMNFRIISQEIDSMLGFLDRFQKQADSSTQVSDTRSAKLLSHERRERREVDAHLRSSLHLSRMVNKTKTSYKGHSIKRKKSFMSYRSGGGMLAAGGSLNAYNRRDSMISLLKEGKHLTIKDFMNSIKGFSEKTIQREIMSMIRDGVLKKEGQRRWSRYYLSS